MTNEKTTKRLKNISGQLLGIVQMLERESSCADVLTQLKAAQAALGSATTTFVQDNMVRCMAEQKISPAKQQEMSYLLKTLLTK